MSRGRFIKHLFRRSESKCLNSVIKIQLLIQDVHVEGIASIAEPMQTRVVIIFAINPAVGSAEHAHSITANR